MIKMWMELTYKLIFETIWVFLKHANEMGTKTPIGMKANSTLTMWFPQGRSKIYKYNNLVEIVIILTTQWAIILLLDNNYKEVVEKNSYFWARGANWPRKATSEFLIITFLRCQVYAYWKPKTGRTASMLRIWGQISSATKLTNSL